MKSFTSILYTYWLFMRTLIIWIILKLCIKRFAIIFAFFMLFFFLQIMEFLYKKKKISALFDNHPYPIRRSIPIASHTSIIRANYIEHAPLINDHNHCLLLAQAVAHPPTHDIIYIVYAIKHLMGGAPPPPPVFPRLFMLIERRRMHFCTWRLAGGIYLLYNKLV